MLFLIQNPSFAPRQESYQESYYFSPIRKQASRIAQRTPQAH